MSETLEQRIRHAAKREPRVALLEAYASDIVEMLDARDTELASQRSALAAARSFAQLVLQPVIFNNPVLIQDAARNLLAALPNAGKE